MIRLALRVDGEHAELVLAELLELAPSGVEETELEGGAIEYAVYGAPGELPDLPDLRALAGGALVEISTSELADDWHERWKAFHSPVMIEPPSGSAAAALYVRPPWEPRSERAGVHDIAIDPGQAFGTGAHASTRMCLELLLEIAQEGPERGAALDVGTGSGVLAIAAAMLGFEPVLGLDNELESVAAAAENAAANGVLLQAARYELRSEQLPWDLAPRLVLANLLRPLLVELEGRIPAPPRHLIASGLLRAEADAISDLYGGRLGMVERSRRESGEWSALWLVGAGDEL